MRRAFAGVLTRKSTNFNEQERFLCTKHANTVVEVIESERSHYIKANVRIHRYANVRICLTCYFAFIYGTLTNADRR